MKEITSLSNGEIKELLHLQDKKERTLKKQFIIEGMHLVKEAYENNKLKIVLGINRKDLELFTGIDQILVNDVIIKKFSTTVTPQPIVGISEMPKQLNIQNLIKKNHSKIVILDDVKDPGNLGTIIRTSAALGYDAVIVSPNTCELYNEKVIRSTQGTIYHINYLVSDLKEVIKTLKENNFNVYGTSLKNASSISDVKPSDKLAVIFGNEAHGVSDEVLNITTKNIKLEMKNNVESLNVSIAAGIIMYELNK